MSNSYDLAIKKAVEDIQRLDGHLKTLSERAEATSKNIAEILGSNNTKQSEVIKNIKTTNEELSKYQKTIKEIAILEKAKSDEVRKQALFEERLAGLKLSNAKKELDIKSKEQREIERVTKAKQQEIDKAERLSKAKERETAKTIELSRAYNQLLEKQKQAKKVLQDLIVTQGRNSAETKKAQREYDILSRKIGQADNATNKFSKGGLLNVASGFRNLLGAFGIVGGVQMFANLVTSSYEVIKAFDSVNYGFQKVITNHGELVRAQSFLLDISKKYGVELLSISEKYLKFYIASRTANVAVKDIEKTFRVFTEASATLGLTTEKTNRIFLALEQMMSKGTVSSEELRLQLGDSLPAAFELMAQALGVTTGELQKMLRAGDVLSKDAIPKLAKAVQDFYKLNGDAANNLQTSSSKLKTSWQQLITSFGDMKWWKNTLWGITQITDGLYRLKQGADDISRQNTSSSSFKWLQDISNMSIGDAQKKLDELRKTIKIVDDMRGGGKMFSSLTKEEMEISKKYASEKSFGVLKGKADAYREYIKLLKEQDKTERENLRTSIMTLASNMELTDAQADRFSVLGKEKLSVKELVALQKELMTLSEKAQEDTIPFYQKKIEENEKLKLSLKSTNEEDIKKARIIDAQNEEYQKQIDLINNKKLKNDSEKLFQQGSEAFLQNEIKLLEDKLVNQKLTKKEYDILIDQINTAEQALSKYYRTMRGKPDEDTQSGGLKQKGLAPMGNTLSSIEIKKQLEATLKGEQEKLKALKTTDDGWYKQFLLVKNLREQIEKLGDVDIVIPVNTDKFDDIIDKFERFEKFKEIFGGITDTFGEMFDIDTSKFDFIFDKLGDDTKDLFGTESVKEWANLSKELIGSVLNASMQRYEIELQEAQRVRDLTLNNDLATEEAKENARMKFEREERRIKTERAKQERQNTLIMIGIDTARGALLAYYSQLVPGDPTSILRAIGASAIATGFGLAQAAIVASQPLPQFEQGTDNAPQGWAITQEKRPEPIVSKDGRLKTMGSKGGDSLTYLEKGDRVFKSQDAFFDEFDIQRATMNMNAYSNGDILNSNVIDLSLLNEIKGLKASNDKVWKEVKALASRPINVNNKVEIKQDRAY